MKRGTGKKIILLAVLLALVGGIVYTVLTWPIYPQPRKNVDSYAQLRQDMEKTGVLSLRRTSFHGWKRSTVKSWMAGTG